MSLRVYAIVGGHLARRVLTRAKGAKVRSVSAGATSAVVTECEGPLLPTAQALREHDAVVRRVARVAPAVLPVRFGTLVDSDRSLVALLDARSEDLQRALALVNRHCQMTLRLFALAGVVAPPERSGPGDDTAEAETHPGRCYLTRRARAHASSQCAPELEPLREAFAPIVAAERIARHDRGSLVLTAYHLIPRDEVPTYRRLLRRHAAALGCRAALSGPWPPYAFVPELPR